MCDDFKWRLLIHFVFVVIISGCGQQNRDKQTQDSENQRLHVDSLHLPFIQLYLDKINQQGGIHGRPVELLIFDEQNQPALAREVALKIIKPNQALAVIGHYMSSTSIAAAPNFYKFFPRFHPHRYT
ncbi:MAG: hypothetical protein DRR19_06345 [Candidatus Parabeggiatoa sp. nov. 1]|nr:MAG: hypothetical protein DRR19_06345 [Gammaproteobacteria bacterium]